MTPKVKVDPIKESFGIWHSVKDSIKFVRTLRKDSEKRRMKRLKI